MFGTVLQYPVNYPSLVFGTFTMYFGAGFVITIIPRLMDEIVPREYYGSFYAL